MRRSYFLSICLQIHNFENPSLLCLLKHDGSIRIIIIKDKHHYYFTEIDVKLILFWSQYITWMPLLKGLCQNYISIYRYGISLILLAYMAHGPYKNEAKDKPINLIKGYRSILLFFSHHNSFQLNKCCLGLMSVQL